MKKSNILLISLTASLLFGTSTFVLTPPTFANKAEASSYDENVTRDYPRLFNVDTEINYETAGTYKRTFTYKPTNDECEFQINAIDADIYHFSMVDPSEIDYRGTYLAIAEKSKKAYNTGADNDYQADNGNPIDIGEGLDTNNHTLTTSNLNLYRFADFEQRHNASNKAAFNLVSNGSLLTYNMTKYNNMSTIGYSDYDLESFNSYLATNA